MHDVQKVRSSLEFLTANTTRPAQDVPVPQHSVSDPHIHQSNCTRTQGVYRACFSSTLQSLFCRTHGSHVCRVLWVQDVLKCNPKAVISLFIVTWNILTHVSRLCERAASRAVLLWSPSTLFLRLIEETGRKFDSHTKNLGLSMHGFCCRLFQMTQCFGAISIHFLKIHIVQVDVRRGHTTKAQLLCEERKLIEGFGEEGWPGAGWQMDTHEVDRGTRQGHSYSHQRVDGVTVKRHYHQEYTAQTVHHREEQGQLDRPGQIRLFDT